MAPDLVHLVAEGGAVISFTLPLAEHVEKQWRAGELTRVRGDGTPWDEAGDDPDTLAAVSDPAGGEPAAPDGDVVEDAAVRPRDSAHITHWRRYAVAIGACSAEDAAAMTKAALVELVTPPEERPADPEA